MNINATLIVQACNFFIAYIFLRIFFFKPVVAVLRQDQAHHDGLVGQLTEKRKSLQALEQSRQEQWRHAQQEFSKHIPDVTASDLYIFQGLSPQRQVTVLDDIHIKQLEHELAQAIIKKVEHAGG